MRLTGPQVRGARGMIGWSQSELASAAGIGLATVQRLEAQDGVLRGMSDTIWKIQDALEKAGIVFIDDDETGGPGLRLAKQTSEDR